MDTDTDTDNEKMNIVKSLYARRCGLRLKLRSKLKCTVHFNKALCTAQCRVRHVTAETKLRPVEELIKVQKRKLCGWVEEVASFQKLEQRNKWVNKSLAACTFPVGDYTWKKDTEFDFGYKNFI